MHFCMQKSAESKGECDKMFQGLHEWERIVFKEGIPSSLKDSYNKSEQHLGQHNKGKLCHSYKKAQLELSFEKIILWECLLASAQQDGG